MANIHPTALVSADAAVADDAEVGAYAIVGAHVTVGSGSVIGPFTRIEGPVAIGERNVFHGHVSCGTPPQDLKYKGEKTELTIGNDNVVREFVTVNRGTTGGGGRTSIGSENFFMAYSHVAHDCHVGSNTIFANNATLAGHVEIGDFATIGETVVGEGTKIDNLVQIGHGVKIGKHCLLVAQVGIAGSTELGDDVVVAGQSGFSGHLKIGNRVQVAAKSAVLGDVPDDAKVMGSPAMPFRDFARREALLKRLMKKKPSP